MILLPPTLRECLVVSSSLTPRAYGVLESGVLKNGLRYYISNYYDTLEAIELVVGTLFTLEGGTTNIGTTYLILNKQGNSYIWSMYDPRAMDLVTPFDFKVGGYLTDLSSKPLQVEFGYGNMETYYLDQTDVAAEDKVVFHIPS